MNPNLIKLEADKKDSYLNNLDAAAKMAESYLKCGGLFKNFQDLISILYKSSLVEVDCSNGLPSKTSMLGANIIKKDIDKEFEDLKSKISSGVQNKHGDPNLEQMLVERIKSKIYSFDTFTADEIKSEGINFHEILNTEFTLRNRLYLLEAVKASSFNLDGININCNKRNGNIEVIGFDSRHNVFLGYNIDFSYSGPKAENKIFGFVKGIHGLRPKFEKKIKENFLEDVTEMYKIFSNIRNIRTDKIVKITLGPYADANTGEVENLPLPENFFKEYPDAYVLDVSMERIAGKEVNRKVYKFCLKNRDSRKKLKDFYKDDESVEVLMHKNHENHGFGGN